MRDRYGWLSVVLSAVLIGQSPAVGSEVTEGHRPAEGKVSFDLYWGYQIIARGSAGSLKGLNFLLDTGTSPAVLDREVAHRLHLEEHPASIRVVGGTVQAATAIVPSLSVGPTRRDNLPVFIEDLSFFSKALPFRVDGVIGLDVLGQGAFLIDYAARQIHFGPLPLLPNSLALRIKDGLGIIEAEVNGVPARLLLDTGTASLVLFSRKSPATDLTVNLSSSSIGEFARRQVKLRSFRLGETVFPKEQALVVAQDAGAGEAFDGLVGPAALGITKLAIDPERGEVAFSR